MYYLHFRDYDAARTIETEKFSDEIASLISFFLGSGFDLKFVVEGNLLYKKDEYSVLSFNEWIKDDVEWKMDYLDLHFDEESNADKKYKRLMELMK